MTPRRRLPLGLLAAGLVASLLCGAAWAAVTASADRTQLAPGDTVELTLQSDRGGAGQPELAPLAKDFDILRRSSSNSLQIVNGSVSSQRQIRLTLAPRRSGRVEVPRLAWDGEQSAVIELIVAANGAGGKAGAGAAAVSVADVFFTTTLDALTPHVQSAVSLQLRLYSDKKLFQASVDFPGNPDALVRRIGADETTQETRNGRTYQVITRSYVLVPQRSGEIELDGPVLTAEVADGHRSFDPFVDPLFGPSQFAGGAHGTRALRLRGDPLRLVVKPRPPGLGSGDWLPAQGLTLDDRWQPADAVIAVGQPVTRQLRLSAVGLGASQLPDLGSLMAVPPGLTAHAEEAKLVDSVQDGHIVGQREQDIALLADRVGRFELPALRVAWWDVVAHRRREAVLPAFTLEVVAGANAASAPTAAAAATAMISASSAAPAAPLASPALPDVEVVATIDRPTLNAVWIGLGCALLALGTLVAWIALRRRRQRRGSRPEPAAAAPEWTVARARRAYQQACRDHAARRARDALLAWARLSLKAPPAGLNALARRLGDADITPLLRELDRACLSDSAWNGEALARALPTLDGDRRPPPQTARSLPGLYSEQDA